MSYSDNESGWQELDEDDLPDLTTEEGRDKWVEILTGQDDETLAQNDSGWCKALTVADEHGNMVVRFVYPDGDEEIFDVVVRRAIKISTVPVEERN